jgi:hypothetical protein
MTGWLRHQWGSRVMEGVREYFCAEGSSSMGKCAVPILGGLYFGNETAWCEFYHNATDCQLIRDHAQVKAYKWMFIMLMGTGGGGIVNFFSVLVSMALAVKICTPSVVMTYGNDNMTSMLLLPAFGCLGLSIYLFSHRDYSQDHVWMASLFLSVASATVVNSVLGFLGGRYKLKAVLLVYCCSTTIVILLLIGLSVTGYEFASGITERQVLRPPLYLGR